ncbi:hypothetical protein DFS34DRAFT_590063 [Phlyctochytrium arcticum]|nr:hypothetical protein DFS34DRAFT_590063 [Phlyctochytrium arcticum]
MHPHAFKYVFKAPGWREIKPFATKNETLAVLRSAIGHSGPAVLPIELLHAICKQINQNDNHTHQALIKKWTPIECDPFDTAGWNSPNDFTHRAWIVGHLSVD